MKYSTIFFTILLLAQYANSIENGLVYKTKNNRRAKNIPEIYKKTPDFIESSGFNAETYVVKTDDGYFITLHRIPGTRIGEKEDHTTNRRVIFLQHGVAAASDCWIILGKRSFPIILAENGFDVWMASSRGTSYSNRHINLTADDPAYWNFSFHENAIYDLTASIDKALEVSGKPNLIYVGHSRGCTQAFVLLSSMPEYNRKIRLFVAYAPVIYLKHTRSRVLQSFLHHTSAIKLKQALEQAEFYNAPIRNKRGRNSFARLCGGLAFNPCIFLFNLFMGSETTLDTTYLPVIFSHFPNGESTKTLLHFLQVAQTDEFAQFDYGKNNLQIYGSRHPPSYDISKITSDIVIFSSTPDELEAPEDLDHIRSQLRTIVGFFPVNDTNFNHIDFTWGIHAVELLFKPTIKFILDNGY